MRENGWRFLCCSLIIWGVFFSLSLKFTSWVNIILSVPDSGTDGWMSEWVSVVRSAVNPTWKSLCNLHMSKRWSGILWPDRHTHRRSWPLHLSACLPPHPLYFAGPVLLGGSALRNTCCSFSPAGWWDCSGMTAWGIQQYKQLCCWQLTWFQDIKPFWHTHNIKYHLIMLNHSFVPISKHILYFIFQF